VLRSAQIEMNLEDNAMQIAQETEGEAVILALTGQLDSSAAQSAETTLSAALGAGSPQLVLDMSGLDYISSAGLRVLLVVAKKAQQAKGKMALCGLSPNVREVFSVSGFDTIFSIQPDRAAAIAAVR
jgi:anti-anti-sigma factor